MGYSVFTIAIRGKDVNLIHSDFGVEPTGETEEIPESPVVGAQLPDGWYLMYFNDYQAPSPQLLERWSRSAELVCCFAEEHVMVSSASNWKDGREIWSVIHNAAKGLQHLETTGSVPSVFSAIRNEFFTQPAEGSEADCIFDIPIELAFVLNGFRYDGNNPGGYPVARFDILKRLHTKKWWHFWI